MALTNLSRTHVFHDLQPYICTIGGCSEDLATFPTRQLWFEHELTKHRAKTLLECHECLRQCDTEAEFLHHHKSEHARYFTKSQLRGVLSSSRKYMFFSLVQLQCPLCLQSNWASQDKFVTHLGRHMEDIALASLPADAGSPSDPGSDPDSEVDSQISQRRRDSSALTFDPPPMVAWPTWKHNASSTTFQASQAQGPDAGAINGGLSAPLLPQRGEITAQGRNGSDSDRDTYRPVRSRRRIASQAKPSEGKTPKRMRQMNSTVLGESKLSTRGPSSKVAKS